MALEAEAKPLTASDHAAEHGQGSIDLLWIPLGAGAQIVRWNGRVFEAVVSRLEHRNAEDLYHSALEVRLDGDCLVIEMAPAWGNKDPERGVVATGTVGMRWLGRSRFFRYEIRRWRNGVVPDRLFAVGEPLRVSASRQQSERLLELVPGFPTVTWGRDELGVGEMWNSNSLVSWLLVRSGHDLKAVRPPLHGRAPGWFAPRAGRSADRPEDGGDTRYAAPRSVEEADWVYHAAVTRRWKLIEWDQLGTYEMYDLRADPDEVDSLADQLGYGALQRRLIKRLDRLRSCVGADCG